MCLPHSKFAVWAHRCADRCARIDLAAAYNHPTVSRRRDATRAQCCGSHDAWGCHGGASGSGRDSVAWSIGFKPFSHALKPSSITGACIPSAASRRVCPLASLPYPLRRPSVCASASSSDQPSSSNAGEDDSSPTSDSPSPSDPSSSSPSSSSSSSSSSSASPSPAPSSPDDSAAPLLSATDWRTFRARLVASERAEVRVRPGDGGVSLGESLGEGALVVEGVEVGETWAHALLAPEKGCLLVASELLHGYKFFERSVILLLSVGTSIEDGPYGIALNKPYRSRVQEVDGMDPSLSSTFGPCRVHLGGPIGWRSVLLVHGIPGLGGHTEIAPGAFVGGGLQGLQTALRAVKTGKAAAEDFQFVVGYSGWGGEQLMREVEQGWWYVAACSSDLLLKAAGRAGGGDKIAGEEGRGGVGEGRGWDLWQEVLTLMGGDYAEVGRRYRD
ncbi:unnamed protein product [Closterium sp. NIES-65]|nr:unnamed protein product [Closterium sp. NIES-65]